MKLLPILFLVVTTAVQGQKSAPPKIDLSAARSYMNLGKRMQAGTPIDSIQWTSLFRTFPYPMMILGGAMDTTVFKKEMFEAFGKTINPSSKDSTYHKEYQQHQKELEQYLEELSTVSVIDSVKKYLYQLLPSRLQAETYFPKLYYLFYGPESTGANGFVLNDLLLSCKTDHYRWGLVAAHESFHAIVSMARYKVLRPRKDPNSSIEQLLFLMSNISEEGMADLIDKPLLEKKGSPVARELALLKTNDLQLAKQYLLQIDQLFKKADESDSIWKTFGSNQEMNDLFGSHGGHIPGRIMGKAIQEAGLLSQAITSVEDPFLFFLLYDKAAIICKKGKYPRFSKESIHYLQQLRQQMIKLP